MRTSAEDREGVYVTVKEGIHLALTFIKLSHYCQQAYGSMGTFEMTIK